MRSVEQINNLKEHRSPPIQFVDILQLHCASNFLDTGATSKLGLSIFTTID
jgi:hypothetical protein